FPAQRASSTKNHVSSFGFSSTRPVTSCDARRNTARFKGSRHAAFLSSVPRRITFPSVESSQRVRLSRRSHLALNLAAVSYGASFDRIVERTFAPVSALPAK